MTKHIIIAILAAIASVASLLAMFFLLNPAFIFITVGFFAIFDDQMRKIARCRG